MWTKTPDRNATIDTPGPANGLAMTDVAGVAAPAAPRGIADCGVEPEVLSELALKLAFTMPTCSTEWAAEHLCLPAFIVAEVFEQLKEDRLIEYLGQLGPLNYRMAISDRGRERAARLMEISGYVGAAPVSLDGYNAMLERQFAELPEITHATAANVLESLVLPEEAVELVGFAVSSGRSLFIYGPPGNGKTTIGRLLHSAFTGDLWIPSCVAVGRDIIRIFDPQVHEPSPLTLSPDDARRVDARWRRVRRPFIMVGGELTMEALDLGFSPAHGYYEAPLHMKANGGIFLLDDFGCQRVEARDLLNRWVVPLDRQIDFMTLRSGQKIQVPMQQMLVVSTNLDPDRVMDPAFLRRLGYRLHLENPTPRQYAEIFQRYAEAISVAVPAGLIDRLLQRYVVEGRDLHSCEPRDLIERVRDICRFRGTSFELTDEHLAVAWRGYFGEGAALAG